MSKIIIYIVIIPIVIWAIDSINFNKFLRSDKPFQARLLYILLIFGLANLIVGFIIDFSNIGY